MTSVALGPDVVVGAGEPLVLIGGPCAIEDEAHAVAAATAIRDVCKQRGTPFVFKSSFDKANRTSIASFRGPGIDEGLRVLDVVRRTVGVPVLTDIHEPWQASVVADVVDVLQIPAFLCRQTDLLLAAGTTGLPVNVKKGQFLAPAEMVHVVRKLEDAGARGIVLTERGSSFGYNNLVVDFRSLPQLRAAGHPVVFDATHSVQLPGAADGRSGGQRQFVPYLARAAVAVGVDGLFMEIHEEPDRAPSDGPNMVPLSELDRLLGDLLALAGSVEVLPPLP